MISKRDRDFFSFRRDSHLLLRRDRHILSKGQTSIISKGKLAQSYQQVTHSSFQRDCLHSIFMGLFFQPTVLCVIRLVSLPLVRITHKTAGTPEAKKRLSMINLWDFISKRQSFFIISKLQVIIFNGISQFSLYGISNGTPNGISHLSFRKENHKFISIGKSYIISKGAYVKAQYPH